MLDCIIKGAEVIDGARTARFRADVGVEGDRIATIGDLSQAQARDTIEASGKIVAPGFIDVHNHSDGWMIKRRHLTAKTSQGFTTEVLMADGISYAPVDQHTAPHWLYYLRALDSLRMDEYRGWRSLADYMNLIHRHNAQNAMTHIPYANVRSMICGWGRHPVDDYQMQQIKAQIRQGMEEGAVGISTGIDYIVQCFSTTDELVEACSAMAEYNGLYVTHVRYKIGLLPALKEAVEIGRRAGVRVHISHLKAPSGSALEEVMEYINNVASNEVDFSFDVYPYQSGSTMLSYLMPYDVWEDGPLESLGKMHDPLVRSKLALGLKSYRLNLEDVRISWVGGSENKALQGQSLFDYVQRMGLPIEQALCNLLTEERLAVLMVLDEGDDRLVHPFLQNDMYMMGSDGIYWDDGTVHPRVYGSTGRLLGSCVRDLKLFSLEDAVYKLSGHAALRFGLKNRGVIEQGNYADLVVFDPATVTDRATYQNPHQTTEGIEHVLVNGESIIADSAPVASLSDPMPGRYLKYHRDD